MKVLVFGAGGKTGRAVVEQALTAGHEVSAILHHAGDLDVHGVTVHEGDAAAPDAVQHAGDRKDAVVDTIGGKTPYKKDTDLESTAAATIESSELDWVIVSRPYSPTVVRPARAGVRSCGEKARSISCRMWPPSWSTS